MRVSGICGRCRTYYRGEACANPNCHDGPRSYRGIIGDAPTTASLPTWLGFPKLGTDEPGKRTHVVVPSKRAWREAVKRNSERIEDIS